MTTIAPSHLERHAPLAATAAAAAADHTELRKRRRARILRTLLIDLVLIAIVLVAAEVGLRRWAPEYGFNQYDHEFTGSYPLDLNVEGYRGPLLEPAKRDGELRVLALGDSLTFGTGVATAHTWPAQLQAMMASADGSARPVSVINGSMPGACLRQLRYAFENKWIDYRPDVVTVAVSGNMVSLAWIRRDDEPTMPHNGYVNEKPMGLRKLRVELSRAYGRLHVPNFLSVNSQWVLYRVGVNDHFVRPRLPYGPLLAQGWRQASLEPQVIADAWKLFERDLEALRRAVESHGCRFVVSYVPSRFRLSDDPWDNEKCVPLDRLTIDPCEKLEAICRDSGIAYADADAAIRKAMWDAAGGRRPMYILFDYSHLDRDGHVALAGAMLEKVHPPATPAPLLDADRAHSGQSAR